MGTGGNWARIGHALGTGTGGTWHGLGTGGLGMVGLCLNVTGMGGLGTGEHGTDWAPARARADWARAG
jgi:hypothetical protein